MNDLRFVNKINTFSDYTTALGIVVNFLQGNNTNLHYQSLLTFAAKKIAVLQLCDVDSKS